MLFHDYLILIHYRFELWIKLDLSLFKEAQFCHHLLFKFCFLWFNFYIFFSFFNSVFYLIGLRLISAKIFLELMMYILLVSFLKIRMTKNFLIFRITGLLKLIHVQLSQKWLIMIVLKILWKDLSFHLFWIKHNKVFTIITPL